MTELKDVVVWQVSLDHKYVETEDTQFIATNVPTQKVFTRQMVPTLQLLSTTLCCVRGIYNLCAHTCAPANTQTDMIHVTLQGKNIKIGKGFFVKCPRHFILYTIFYVHVLQNVVYLECRHLVLWNHDREKIQSSWGNYIDVLWY